MAWDEIKLWLFREKRIKVKIVAKNGKVTKSFTAKSVSIKPHTYVFTLENDLKIKVSRGLDFVVEEVWMYDGIIVNN